MSVDAHIEILLDRSCSMGEHQSEVIDRVNAYLASGKTIPGTVTASLSMLRTPADGSAIIESIYTRVPAASVADLTMSTYVPVTSGSPPFGATPLFDAVGQVLTTLKAYVDGLPKKDQPSKVYIAIDTDGSDNGSRVAGVGIWTITTVRALVTTLSTAPYQWDFRWLYRAPTEWRRYARTLRLRTGSISASSSP